jgi:hypothetical protein
MPIVPDSAHSRVLTPVSGLIAPRTRSRTTRSCRTQMMTPRRRPHCKQCGSPMAGHKRPNGAPECPALLSPPATPSPDAPPVAGPSLSRALGRSPAAIKLQELSEGLEPLSTPGYFYRKNPNWLSEPRRRHTPEPRADDDGESLVPTVLVDEDEERRARQHAMIRKRESHRVRHDSPDLDDSISVRIARAEPSLQAVWDTMGPAAPPPAALYPVHGADLSRLQRGAERLGLHMGAIPSPRSGLKHEELTGEDNFICNRVRRASRIPSFWAVLGHDRHAVEHICDLQRGHAEHNCDRHHHHLSHRATSPGLLRTETLQYNLGTPRGLVFSQLVLATVVGGLLMFWMLTMV